MAGSRGYPMGGALPMESPYGAPMMHAYGAPMMPAYGGGYGGGFRGGFGGGYGGGFGGGFAPEPNLEATYGAPPGGPPGVEGDAPGVSGTSYKVPKGARSAPYFLHDQFSIARIPDCFEVS